MRPTLAPIHLPTLTMLDYATAPSELAKINQQVGLVALQTLHEFRGGVSWCGDMTPEQMRDNGTNPDLPSIQLIPEEGALGELIAYNVHLVPGTQGDLQATPQPALTLDGAYPDAELCGLVMAEMFGASLNASDGKQYRLVAWVFPDQPERHRWYPTDSWVADLMVAMGSLGVQFSVRENGSLARVE